MGNDVKRNWEGERLGGWEAGRLKAGASRLEVRGWRLEG
jgi:hypothetical protein